MSLQIAVEKVRWLAAGLLELNGCDADIAQDVAEHMIEAERYGFASHGVTLLPKPVVVHLYFCRKYTENFFQKSTRHNLKNDPEKAHSRFPFFDI